MKNQGLGDLPVFQGGNSFPKPDVTRLVKDQAIEEKDYQYMTKMYSKEAREALEYIEEACDKLEYEGSMMFHEYLDRTQMLMIADKVYYKMCQGKRETCMKCDSVRYQLIYVLLCGEMYHRRCRYHRKKCYLDCK